LENWYIPISFLCGFFCSFYQGGWFLIFALIAGIVFFFLGNCLNFISFGYAAQVRFPDVGIFCSVAYRVLYDSM